MVKLLLRALEELIMYRQKKKKKANNASLDVKLVNVCLSGHITISFELLFLTDINI